MDNWTVPPIGPDVKPNELLINISRLILGPAGTEVRLKLRRTSAMSDHLDNLFGTPNCESKVGYSDDDEDAEAEGPLEKIPENASTCGLSDDSTGREGGIGRGRGQHRYVEVKLIRCSTSPIRHALAQRAALMTSTAGL